MITLVAAKGLLAAAAAGYARGELVKNDAMLVVIAW